MADEAEFEVRKLSKDELACVVRLLRTAKGWTQETLAELTGVSSRTIQRLEDGQGAAPDTLRAIARAVDAKDLDFLVRPEPLLTAAGLKRRQEAFEREHLMLDASPAPSGRAVEAFMTGLNMLCCVDDAVEDEVSRAEAASLFDYLQDYLDVKGEVSHQDRLTVSAELQQIVARLQAAGWTPVVGVRRTQLMNDSWVDKTPWPVTIGYLALVPVGQEPPKLAVRRRIQLE